MKRILAAAFSMPKSSMPVSPLLYNFFAFFASDFFAAARKCRIILRRSEEFVDFAKEKIYNFRH
ncbi:MAG: hypothetical protein KH334_03795 [Clostridiales bacterium]|nr:hypothetical protein [Clostridiales bacterium]